jgi:hypothetical protein
LVIGRNEDGDAARGEALLVASRDAALTYGYAVVEQRAAAALGDLVG